MANKAFHLYTDVRNPVVDTIKAGDYSGGDYFEIRADGTVWFNGSATMWDDLRGSLIGKRLSSVAGAVAYDYAENAVVFKPNGDISDVDDCVSWNLQFPHAAKASSSVHLHMHYEQLNGTDDLQFTLWYRIQDNNNTKTTAWTPVTISSLTNNVFTYPGSGTFNQIVELAEIDMTGKGISSTVQFRMTRSDTIAGNILGTFIDAHVEYDQLGSADQYVKGV